MDTGTEGKSWSSLTIQGSISDRSVSGFLCEGLTAMSSNGLPSESSSWKSVEKLGCSIKEKFLYRMGDWSGV